MKRFAVAAAVGALLLTGIGVAPAYAVQPDAPGIVLDTATPGHITGTVSSADQPFVQVSLPGGPAQVVTLSGGSGTFDLETWGYDPAEPVTVSAIACPAEPINEPDCSTPTASTGFNPKDLLPDVSLNDSTIGPADTPSLTSSDPGGGGVLRATWTPSVGTPVVTTLDRNGSTPLDIAEDGDGSVTVERCATTPADQCTGFDPAISLEVHVHRVLATSVSPTPIATIDTVNPTSDFTVTTDPVGTGTLTWHLEDPAAPGVPVGTNGQTDALGPGGTIDGSKIPVDGHYQVVGTVTVANDDYGTYTNVPFSGPFTVDRSGALPGITLDPATTGHITGTVTSPDQGFVRVTLGTAGPTQVVTLANGTGTFGLDTWGFDPAADVNVTAVACPDVAANASCSGPSTSDPFKPLDVTPQVTLSTDTAGLDPPVSATSADPNGGGILKATWNPDHSALVETTIARNGTTTLNVSEGNGVVVISRCADAPVVQCTDYPALDQTLLVDWTRPAVTSIARSTAVVYPNVTGWAKYPAGVTFTVTGGDAVKVRITNGSKTTTVNITNGKAPWNGRIGSSVVAGPFTVHAIDGVGNPSAISSTVIVDPRRIVTKTWTKVVTAKRSMPENGFFVARCSTMRRPSARGWAGSIGYYANTKCGDRSWTASAVTTVHSIRLPRLGPYLDLHVDTYGAAARRRPLSRGLIRYLTRSGDWVSIRPVGPRLGWHAGYARSVTSMLYEVDNSVAWSFASYSGNKYDVWKFRVVLHYKGLG